jgi:hypothetical protein
MYSEKTVEQNFAEILVHTSTSQLNFFLQCVSFKCCELYFL